MRESLSRLLQQTLESYKNVNPHLENNIAGWEVWYAHWMLTISDIRDFLGLEPTPATLEKLLLKGDALYMKTPTTKSWAEFVADEMLRIVTRYNRTKTNK